MQPTKLKCTVQVAVLQGKKKKLRCTCPVGKWVSVFLAQLLILLVLWASWKELKEQACFTTCPETMFWGIMSNMYVYLSFEWVNTNSHRQNNLSRTRGHHVFRSLSYRQRVQCLSKGRQVLARYEMTFLLKKTPHFCYKHCHKIILNSDFVLKPLLVQVFTDNHQFPSLCFLKAILTANIDTTWTEKAHFFHTYRGVFVLAYSELHVGMI